MATTRTTGVILLTPQYFDMFVTGMPEALRFPFAPEIIRDLDIIAKDIFKQQLEGFTKNNKIPSANILLLLSDQIIFCKEFTAHAEGNTGSHTNDSQLFLDAVPFEHVIDKLYRFDKKEILVATNKDFLDIFQSA